MAAVKKTEFRAPKKLQFIFAVFALIIIIGLVAVMLTQLILKTSELVGIQQNPAATVNCTDTDGGNIQDTFGTCTDSTRQAKSDTCVFTGVVEELKLQEWSCDKTKNACVSEIKACQPGFMCSAGKCVKA